MESYQNIIKKYFSFKLKKFCNKFLVFQHASYQNVTPICIRFLVHPKKEKVAQAQYWTKARNRSLKLIANDMKIQEIFNLPS